MQDKLPTRLGGLAASLARIASIAQRNANAAAVATLLEETRYLIEWSAPEADLDVAAELVEIQIALALWNLAWPQAQKDPVQRAMLAFQSKIWSERTLEHSGLLDEA